MLGVNTMTSCYQENLGLLPAEAQLFLSALSMQVQSLTGDTVIVAGFYSVLLG